MLVCLLLGWSHRHYCVDDGFIFARVAENWVKGLGWGFNPGHPVNVNTSILWTWVMATLTPVGLSTETVAVAFTLSVLLAAAAIGHLTRDLGAWTSAAVTAACVSCTTLWEATGLESALALALVAWTVVAVRRGRRVTAGALLALAILCRPDAMLLGALLTGAVWWTERRVPWRMVLTAALVLTPWCLYAWFTLGSILPVTLQAKTAQSSLGSWGALPPFAIAALTYNAWWLPCLALTLAWFWSWRGRRVDRLPDSALLVVYGLAHAAAYSVLRAPADYIWYYIPLHLSLLLGAVYGLQALMASRGWLTPVARSRLLAAVAASLGALFLWRGLHAGEYRLSREYREMGALLRDRCAPDDRVASVEIGYVGHTSGCQVLDIHGLIHPESLPLIRQGRSLWWLDRGPRYILTHTPRWFGEPKEDELPASYRQIHRIRMAAEVSMELWEREPAGP